MKFEIHEVIDQVVSAFLDTTCGCRFGLSEQPCSNLFSEAAVFEVRSQCMELTSDELDMFLLGSLNAQTKDCKRKRCRSDYFFKGHQVCRKTFMFLHSISKKRLQNLKSHLENNGITSRVHGNTRRTPHNRTTHASLRHVVTFIENYAEREGLSLPGRVPGYKSFRLKLLPTSTNKAELWRRYKDAAEEEGFEVMGYTKFVTTWNDFLPFIKIMQPSTDLCHTCQKNTEKISGKANVSEDEKMAAIAEHSDHLNKAKSERELYNAAVDESKTVLKENPGVSLLAPNSPCSLKGTALFIRLRTTNTLSL